MKLVEKIDSLIYEKSNKTEVNVDIFQDSRTDLVKAEKAFNKGDNKTASMFVKQVRGDTEDLLKQLK